MKTASVSEAKNRLSYYLNLVKNGEVVFIMNRGTPVAKLEALTHSESDDERLKRLYKAGILRPAKKKLTPDFFNSFKRVVPKGDVDIVKMIREERDKR